MRCPWFRHCQSAFVGLVLLALFGGAILFWQLNRGGFSGEWGERLQEQLDEFGLHAEFSSVHLSLTQGLIAHDLEIYRDADRTTLLASAERMNLDIDRGLALRGQWEIRSAEFENAFIRLPDHCAPHHLDQLTGTARLSPTGDLAFASTSGQLGQLNLQLSLSLQNFALPKQGADEGEKNVPLEDFVAALHREVAHWTPAGDALPTLELRISGNLARPGTLEGRFHFSAPRLARLRYTVEDLALSGRVNSSSLHLEEFTFHDEAGPFTLSGIYDLRAHQLSFASQSTARLDRLLAEGLGYDLLESVTFREAPTVTARGEVFLPADSPPELRLTGHLAVAQVGFLATTWTSLETDFSWQKNNLYLRDLQVRHPEGELAGQVLFQNEVVRYRATTTLPPKVFDPFIEKEGDIRNTIENTEFTPESRLNIELSGSIRPSDLTDWSASGRAVVENIRFHGTPLNYGSATFNLTPLQAVYSQPEVEIDLTGTKSFQRFGGPESAVVRADAIRYDHAEGVTRIEHLHGVCWPSAVLAMFLPEVAAFIERTYRASEPPAFSSTGVIDHREPGERTSFLTRLSAPAPLYYDFLGKAVELRETSVLVHTHHQQVDLRELSSYAFSGPIEGEVSILLPEKESGKPDFRGELKWTRLRLSDLGDTYGFDSIEKGLLTGRLAFFGTADRIETLNGSGLIALEQGELFKAPVFGPLSPLIAGVQGHDRASHETARDASANFLIRNGILYTDDFLTTTDSLTVRAEGAIDLARQTLDMTARADTEGLLKLVTLPLNLSGFDGLLQFRGTGPIADPTWQNTPFTRPAPRREESLFPEPPRVRVVPE
ncbi:AsmA-like C-terminal region-containing protein [Roseibacillus ishigakijimensis]|uniref:AsmA-like C-terminal domain-containing protein n=1 Tax=Roseibacillus ishigakijimensis TaxID=454146 RepID=A0A934RS34_9BACT|nr:AsmA-like C-terminal region-containing protein [Roseibacillus ishigakijimensis]MBK1834626.1 hypothetical protein [Roseibacillus ishigakijimensis]